MLHQANRIEFHCGVPFGLSRCVDRLWLGLPGEVGVLGNEVHMNREVRRSVCSRLVVHDVHVVERRHGARVERDRRPGDASREVLVPEDVLEKHQLAGGPYKMDSSPAAPGSRRSGCDRSR